jgi:hypothetical protein
LSLIFVHFPDLPFNTRPEVLQREYYPVLAIATKPAADAVGNLTDLKNIFSKLEL